MIRDAALGEIIGADALGAVAGAHQVAPRLGLFGLLFGTLHVQQLGGQQGHGAGPVLVLGALVLAFHDDAGGQVGQADGRVGLVDVLAAGPGGAEGVHAQVGGVDLLGLDFGGLGHDRHGRRRGVDAALGFGLGHALHAMGPGLELQPRVGALADDAGDDFLVAAVFALALGNDLELPAVSLGVAGIHAEQVAGEDRRLVPAGARADLEEHVAVVVRVLGEQQLLQRGLQGLGLLGGAVEFVLRHGAHLGIVLAQHVLRRGDVVLGPAPALEGLHHVLELAVLDRQLAELVLVADHVRVGQQARQFLVAFGDAFQLLVDGVFHFLFGVSFRLSRRMAA